MDKIMADGMVKHLVIDGGLEWAWWQALNLVMTAGRKYFIDSGSCEKTHRLTLPMVIEIHNPGIRPLAPRMPESSNIPPPTTDEKINEYAASLVTSEKQENQHYTYGEDLWWQIEEVIKYFKRYGFGNACCYMPVGRPESFFFYNWDVDYREFIVVEDRKTGRVLWTRHISNGWNKDPEVEVSTQCLRGVDCWIEDEKLHFWCYFRSNDLRGAWSENHGGIQIMKEMMAERLGIGDGVLITSCKDLHVYESSWLVALDQLRKDKKILQNR
ncbi:hypothetical protein HZB05_01845 [Candidatus Wolfebacteria bacterium]|nr:hypothetical protein [Candidatus Wolfebacteria bacterium]